MWLLLCIKHISVVACDANVAQHLTCCLACTLIYAYAVTGLHPSLKDEFYNISVVASLPFTLLGLFERKHRLVQGKQRLVGGGHELSLGSAHNGCKVCVPISQLSLTSAPSNFGNIFKPNTGVIGLMSGLPCDF